MAWASSPRPMPSGSTQARATLSPGNNSRSSQAWCRWMGRRPGGRRAADGWRCWLWPRRRSNQALAPKRSHWTRGMNCCCWTPSERRPKVRSNPSGASRYLWGLGKAGHPYTRIQWLSDEEVLLSGATGVPDGILRVDQGLLQHRRSPWRVTQQGRRALRNPRTRHAQCSRCPGADDRDPWRG